MIPCNSSLPKLALLNLTECFSNKSTSAVCNVSDLIELQNKDLENAIVLETTLPCITSPHSMYSGTLYLYPASVDSNYLEKVSGLFFGK